MAELDTAAQCRGQHAGAVARHQGDAAAELFCATNRSLLTWIEVLDLQGIDDLLEKEHLGWPHAIGEEHDERLCDLLLNPVLADLAHWTAKKFHGDLREIFAIKCGDSMLLRWLHDHQFCL